MFNQPRPLRPAKPWQASGYLRSSREDLSFSAASWRKDKDLTFAKSDMSPSGSDFSEDVYQPMNLPLSAQAQKSWALLDDAHAPHDLADGAHALQEDASPNAHLPFVLDVYQPLVPKSAQPGATQTAVVPKVTVSKPTDEVLNASEPVLQPDDLADEVRVEHDASEAITPEATIDRHVEVSDDSAPEMAHDDAALSLSEDTPSESSSPQAEAALQADADTEPHAAEMADEEDQAMAPEATDAADATEAALGDEALSAEAEPTLPAVDASEVAQREAEQFAMGLAQGREEGIAQGRQEGLAEGIAQGEAQAREAMAQEVAAQCELLAQMTQALKTLMADPKQFFEPLKRLSVHLAEQLVLGELSHSSQAIERLIQHCLDEVSHPLQDGVVVELNPDDKKRLQAQGGEFLQGLRLEAVPDLRPGSVRLFANDMVVEDLVEHRLQGLAKDLLTDVASWQKKSVLAQPAVSEDPTEHDDDLA